MPTIKHVRRYTAALVMLTLAAYGDSSTEPDVRVKTVAGNTEWYGIEAEPGKQARVKAQTYSASLVSGSASAKQ